MPQDQSSVDASHSHIKKLLVANRSEIAIRIFRAATELGIRTVAIYTEEDKLALHRFKADEAYLVGRGPHLETPLGPIDAYLSIEEVLRVAKETGADAIHPGYGFLSESPDFALACEHAGLIFIGPSPRTLTLLGNKVSARNLAQSVGVPVMPASNPLPDEADAIKEIAKEIGYPLMLKASWGGGGRGMRRILDEDELLGAVFSAKREAKAAFGKDEVYLEKLIVRARHVEAQILGDHHGALVHLFERDCSVQRRNQKVIERAPSPYFTDTLRHDLCEAALKIGRAAQYACAGTVEFLFDCDTDKFYFIEVNPRIQVEHTVTEVVTGIDLVKAQIRICEGYAIGKKAADGTYEAGVPPQNEISLRGHALQCRITTENPENNFIPDYGRISAYRGAMGFGIRVDGGTAYSGAIVTRFYDSLLEKVTAWANTPGEAIARMDRALKEYRIRGVATNLEFLEAILAHPKFLNGEYTTRFIDETPELFHSPKRQDRATRLLTWIADITVNGHPDVRGRDQKPKSTAPAPLPAFKAEPAPGCRQVLQALGPKGFAQWVKEQSRVLLTDTTMRDAHQSLLATRMRTYDIAAISDAYARGLPSLFSLECWGGATFDVSMRFLLEDPWERLAAIREKAPNILLQMLLRGANGVGYTNYPDNVLRYFIKQACAAGIDVFRIFDCFNGPENMRIAIETVNEEGKIAEGALCYTGDILDPARSKYDLGYYIKLAKDLETAGCHILAIKDMAGLLKPEAARVLVKALKDETGLPIHLHTHDTSGISAATVLAAVDAGVDIVDAAMDSFSGTTSQPCLGSLVAALQHTERDTKLDFETIRDLSRYWGQVRGYYAAFESGMPAGTSEVYLHEMPGGQITNLQEQARASGLENRWKEVTYAYRAANTLLGDIPKVTPSSKVVGDMAIMMVAQGLTPGDVTAPDREVAFPGSVVEMMRGDLGYPPGGFPAALQTKVLKGAKANTERLGASLPPADFAAVQAEAEKKAGRAISAYELASYMMYPKVFTDFAQSAEKYGPVSTLTTPVFFYGMTPGDEITVDIEPGKTLIVRLLAVGDVDEDGQVKMFYELNGHPRLIKIPNRLAAAHTQQKRKAEDGNDKHVPSPMPGRVSTLFVSKGQKVQAGDVLLTLEAMKMETSISAGVSGVISEVLVSAGAYVDAKDLLIVFE